MRVLIFHGYLLGGTGSNVYTARLAAALVREGVEVHLLCQDRHAAEQPFVDAVADWDGGRMELRTLRQPVRCTVYRPDIGPILPVYVADQYEAIEARTFLECSDAEISAYVQANVARVREITALARPELALANHLVMGPLILARALPQRVPYAVKIHGSALEYTVKADPARFLAAAREGVRGARTVLVGSAHSARSLWEALGEEGLRERTFLGPPGVDVALFRPAAQGAGEPGASLGALAQRLRASAGRAGTQAERASTFARDHAEAADALGRLAREEGPLSAFVGKLIVSKGADLLVAAWPLVLARVPRARLAIVGFGAFRTALEALLAALARGDLEQARALALAGRALERGCAELRSDGRPRVAPQAGEGGGGSGAPLRGLLAFLESLAGAERAAYLERAAALPERVVLTGRLEHDELAPLLALCETVVVPSTFPESFGMIAAEAAACGALPICAGHSGLQEVAGALAPALPREIAALLTFPLQHDPVRGIAERVVAWLAAEAPLRATVRGALVEAVRERFSWEGVARGVLAAARGEHGLLLAPPAPGGVAQAGIDGGAVG
jgi:glycosyltransferase involved in cell wall biosynthesis